MTDLGSSTVSKVLRQKEKYLFPESGSLSPVKRAKGKFPDIERALSNWVRNTQKQGLPLTDAAIKDKARFFASTVGNNDNSLKTTSTSWLEKFKQKNGIGSGKMVRKDADTAMSDTAAGHADSSATSTAQTPMTPGSPSLLPSPLVTGKDDEDRRLDTFNNYFDFNRPAGASRHAPSHSTASLSSVMTEAAPSSFSGAPSSPMTPFAFSPDGSGNSWMAQQQARLPPPSNTFSRPRSQTFPNLGIDPAFLDHEASTPKYINVALPDTSSPLDTPATEMTQSFTLDAAFSSPPLNHRSSNGSMGHHSSANSLQSPITPMSPTQDDARRALDTLLNYFQQAPAGLVEQHEYMTVIKLIEKLRLPVGTEPLPGGLHRINEQEGETPCMKLES